MGIKRGVAEMMDFIGQFAGQHSLMKRKSEADAKAAEAKEQQRLTRGLREYNLWTNPDDPARKLMEARQTPEGEQMYKNLGVMEDISESDYLKIKALRQSGGMPMGMPMGMPIPGATPTGTTPTPRKATPGVSELQAELDKINAALR